MKADLHIHSVFSSDGKSAVSDIINRAADIGLGCIAITDHNNFEAYAIAKDNGRVIVIPGVEVSSEEGHILAYGVDRNIPRGLGIKDTIEAIHEAGGYAFAAHPYRWWSGLGEKNTLNYDFDGTEARNARSTPRSNKRSEALAKSIGKPISAGSDAHSLLRIGEGYVELPDGISSWQEALAAIMEGRAMVHSKSRRMKSTLKYGGKSIFQWMFRGFRKM